ASVDKGKVRRVILCTGKVYYDLLKERNVRGLNHIALVRIEQLYPLKYERVAEVLAGYPKLQELLWVQEEPKNMGAWFFIKDRLDERVAGGKYQNLLKVVARKTSPSPAAGLQKVHEYEQQELLNRALS
ncbi:MAG: 2-oxoglutarate dehydrogenase E1 component, partial [Turneriella sp.]|nr:2-oxoglutarate dehydrogenase E1 component [Turneriella sp.]